MKRITKLFNSIKTMPYHLSRCRPSRIRRQLNRREIRKRISGVSSITDVDTQENLAIQRQTIAPGNLRKIVREQVRLMAPNIDIRGSMNTRSDMIQQQHDSDIRQSRIESTVRKVEEETIKTLKQINDVKRTLARNQTEAQKKAVALEKKYKKTLNDVVDAKIQEAVSGVVREQKRELQSNIRELEIHINTTDGKSEHIKAEFQEMKKCIQDIQRESARVYVVAKSAVDVYPSNPVRTSHPIEPIRSVQIQVGEVCTLLLPISTINNDMTLSKEKIYRFAKCIRLITPKATASRKSELPIPIVGYVEYSPEHFKNIRLSTPPSVLSKTGSGPVKKLPVSAQ